ncbi:MAG: tetratricopeptide repeat protein, partial [Pirellulales bacterium]
KMSALDLVISVGNATVHTAGALGVETLALLPKVPIWRWMLHGERSIWYPSVAMVRQEQWCQWTPVLRQATDWLADRLRQRGLSEPQQVHPVAADKLSGSQTAPNVSPALHDPFRTAAPEKLYEEAQRRHQQGDAAGAEALYLRLVKNTPLHADAWNLAGVAAHQQGRHEIALQRIGRAIEMQPAQPLFQFNLACVQTASGLAAEAIAVYRKLCQLAPNMIEAPHNLGALLADRGELVEAIEAYDRALRIDATCVIAHVKRGLALRELGRIDEARQAFEQALKLDPNCHPAAAALNQCRMPAAVDRRPVASSPKRTQTEATKSQIAPLLARAIDLYRQERFDEARPIIAEVLRIDPAELNALRLLGVIERRTGEPRRAIETLQKAIHLAPREAVLHFELGSAYRLAGDLAPAYEHYCRASELDPSLQPAFLNVGAILEDWQRFDEALPWQETAVRLNPKCPNARYNLGNCRMKMGDAAGAIGDYDEAIRLDPDYTRAYWNRANANLLLGDFAAGFADFDYRYKCGEVEIDRYPQPRWRGESLAGKSIVLHAEQGIGDEILFAS